jgi:glycosyltransferase involved in cell wall biosynthesis
MPVKLLYITSNLSLGGAERQLYYLIRGLDKSRFTAHVVPLWPDYTMRSQFEEAGATIVAIHKKCRYDATVLLRLRSFIRVLRPDIVHCQMYTANMWGRIAAVLAGAKTIIVSERNSDYLWKNRWHFAVERRLNRFARVFLGNSHRVCQYCEQNLRLPTGTFRLMYNGVDTNEFRPPSQRLGALSSGPLVGTVANLYPNKDLGTFVRMAVRVSERHPNARFRVIGYGTERDALTSLANQLGIGDRIEFAGACSNVAEEYHRMDVFVLSSRHEGFANVIIEAMASGLPVVATDVGGAREAIDQGRTGFVVQSGDPVALADCVDRLLADSALRNQMGAAGREQAVREFSLEAMVRRYEQLYLEMAGVSTEAPVTAR